MTDTDIVALLRGTYAGIVPPQSSPTVFTPTVRRGYDLRTGADKITVTGLPGLLTGELDAVTDPPIRGMILSALARAQILIRDVPADRAELTILEAVFNGHRREGRITTTYTGYPRLTTDTVLDLGERLADHFTLNPPPITRRRLGLSIEES